MENANIIDTDTLLLVGLIFALLIGLFILRKQGKKR